MAEGGGPADGMAGAGLGRRPSTVQILMREALLQAEKRVGEPGTPLPFSKSLRRALIKVGRIIEAHRSQLPERWQTLARDAVGEEGGQLRAFILQDLRELEGLVSGDAGPYLRAAAERCRSMALGGTPMNRMLKALEAEGDILLGMLIESIPQGPSLWRCTRALDRLLFNRSSVVTDVYFDSFRRSAEILKDVMEEISDVEESLWDGVMRMAITRPDPRAFLADIFTKYSQALNLFDLKDRPPRPVEGFQDALEAYPEYLRQYIGCQDEEYAFLGHVEGIDVMVGPHCFYAARCQKQQALGIPLYCFKAHSMGEFVQRQLGRPAVLEAVALDPGRRCVLRAREVQGKLPIQPRAEAAAAERPGAPGLIQSLPPLEPVVPLDGEGAALVARTSEDLEPFARRVLVDWVKLANHYFQARDLTLLYRVVRVDLLELQELLTAGRVDRYLEEWGDFSRHLADGGVSLSALVQAVKLQDEATLPLLMAGHPGEVERVVRAHERLTRDRLVVTARAYREALQEDALNLARVIDQYNAFTDALWIAMVRRATEEGHPLPFLQAFMDLMFGGFVQAQVRRRPLPAYSPDLRTLAQGILEWMRTLPESPAYLGRAEPALDGVDLTIHQGCPNEARCRLMQRHGIPLVCVEALYFRSYAKYFGHDVTLRPGALDPGRACHSTLVEESPPTVPPPQHQP